MDISYMRNNGNVSILLEKF